MNFSISVHKFEQSKQPSDKENIELGEWSYDKIELNSNTLQELITQSEVTIHPAWCIMSHFNEVVFFKVCDNKKWVVSSQGVDYTIRQFSISKYDTIRLSREIKINQCLNN